MSDRLDLPHSAPVVVALGAGVAYAPLLANSPAGSLDAIVSVDFCPGSDRGTGCARACKARSHTH